MFRDLPRYGAYSPAGEWLSGIPVGWAWEPARTIFTERKETGFVDEQMLSVTIARGVISQQDLLATTAKKDSSSLDKSKYKLVERGDLVYNKMRAWQGAAGGSSHRGIVSPAYIVMTPRSGSTDFFHYVVRTPMFAKEAERWSYGITSDQWTLRPEHFKMIRFPVPPPEEQAAIVKYLAHANARIDKAITAKRRLIALLEEQRAAQVEHVFSSVLENHATGVPLKHLVQIKGGMTPSKENASYWGGAIPWVSPKDVKANILHGSIDRITPAALEETSCSLVPRNSVVIVVRGMILARTVPVAILGVDAALNQDMKALIPRKGLLDAVYLRDWLRVNEPEIAKLVETAGHGTKTLRTDLLMNVRVPVPPLALQTQLSEVAASESAAVEHAVRRIQDEINLLREFRTRLVADVVTGQVDVRAIAATLPDTREPLDDLMADSDDDLADVLAEVEG